MNIAQNVWHYPPELPKNGQMIIWVSDAHGHYNSCTGLWNHRNNGGKNTGANIVRWAYLRDVMLQDVWCEWMSFNNQPSRPSAKLKPVIYSDDNYVIIDGVKYRKESESK